MEKKYMWFAVTIGYIDHNQEQESQDYYIEPELITMKCLVMLQCVSIPGISVYTWIENKIKLWKYVKLTESGQYLLYGCYMDYALEECSGGEKIWNRWWWSWSW